MKREKMKREKMIEKTIFITLMMFLCFASTTCDGNPWMKELTDPLFTCEKKGHKWGAFIEIRRPATCQETGEGVRGCDKCDEIDPYAVIPLQPHTYSGYTVTSASSYPAQSTGTCTTPGCASSHLRNTQNGDTGPGGGKIIYEVTSGFTVEGTGSGSTGIWPDSYTAHYLEAAPTNSGRARWGDYGTEIINITTNPMASNIINTIGNGRKDTALIVAHMASENITETAAQLASATQGGKNDWFLPSLGELNLLFLQMGNIDIVPTGDNYWSSSQFDKDKAWFYNFDSPQQPAGEEAKNNEPLVHAVRAF